MVAGSACEDEAMTELNSVLTDLAGRITDTLDGVVDGLDQDTAERVPAEGSNTICWLLWHSARGIDLQLRGLTGDDQRWVEWKPRLGIPLADDQLGSGEMGYGQSPADAAKVVAPVGELAAYLRVVTDDLVDYCSRVTDAELAKVIDENWDPPVTAGVRLVSLIDDVIQHLGAAAYLRGFFGG
ncbi:hypothetical protein CGZ97_09000 [Enemella evansiae]|nr:hypothetical protein CGZ97_09000 [Enemella evansiae]OYO09986.1 hypothetical protein CGZ98_12840 [Enemella evansiae]